ncbi:hypothetical protein [Flocculibacter collagenilyticus]|uniref:hypothetical protein n=1 Tax=Flocculibacter collagenilyticus TaxID=2744479 RepID=UPI0018F6FE67|nr:hypothetical protein [Flocculibacter collagenilyticus]
MINVSCIATVNAAGCNLPAFYGAVETNMLFATPASSAVKIDDSLISSYLSVEIEALTNLDRSSRLLMLLEEGITRASKYCNAHHIAIAKILIVSPLPIVKTEEDKAEEVEASANSVNSNVITDLVSTAFDSETISSSASQCITYTDTLPALDTLEDGTLIIALDSQVLIEQASELNNHTMLQVAEGPVGAIVGEGLAAFLISTEPLNVREVTKKTRQNKPTANSVKTLKADSALQSIPSVEIAIHQQNGANELSQLIKQADLKLGDLVIHAGATSEIWTKQWYQITQSLYHKNNHDSNQAEIKEHNVTHAELIEHDMCSVVGYLGCATLPSAFALATAFLTQPINHVPRVFVVHYQLAANTSYFNPTLYTVRRN